MRPLKRNKCILWDLLLPDGLECADEGLVLCAFMDVREIRINSGIL